MSLPSGPSNSLGIARAQITMDLSALLAAQAQIRTIAGQMSRDISGIGGTIGGGAGGGLNQLGQSARQAQGFLGGLRTEVLALGATGGLVTKFGLDAALSVRNYGVAFTQFTGSQKESSKLMSELTKKADEFGLEVEGVWQLGRSLLPILKGNTAELDKWVVRGAMLRSVFPAAQKGAETRAISEFMAGQTMSMQRLFNIPPSIIAQAKAQFSDIGDQIDFILQRMGATEAGARQMANGFVSVTNELKLAAATGFEPLFKAMQPVLHGFTEFLQGLRDTNPGILTFGAGVAAIAAVGAPSLLLLNQMVIAAQKLKVLGALGAGGLYAGAALAGATIGVQTMRGIGQATGNESLKSTSLQSVFKSYAQVAFIEMVGIVKYFGNMVKGVLFIFGNFMKGLQLLYSPLSRVSSEMGEVASALLRAIPAIDGFVGRLLKGIGVETGLLSPTKYGLYGDRASEDLGSRAFVPTGPQVSTAVDYARSIQQIERDAGQARLDATNQYESSRSEAVFSYEQGIAREEQDFGISRQRQAEDLAANIARIGLDSSRQAAQWAEDLADSIAKMQADSGKRVAEAQEASAKRLAEIDAEYAKNRQRAERDHKDNLLEAAANLDAKAVFNEQRNFARSSQDAKEAHDDAISKEKENLAERTQKEAENLAERIQQEQEANAKRLADAKEADNLRIQDAKDALAKQQAQEDEDRALRLQRGAEDQAHQLAQMEQAQNERLAQIDRHAAEERTAADDAFNKALEEEGIHNQRWLEQQKLFEEAALKQARAFWRAQLDLLPQMFGPTTAAQKQKFIEDGIITDPFASLESRDSGGPIWQSKPHRMKAGEYVLDPATVARMGGFSGARQVAMSGGGRSVSVGDISFSIYPLPGQNAGDIAAAVRSEVLSIFNNELQ